MYGNTWEVTAEQEGWKVYKVVDTKEEALEIVNQLRALKIQCRRMRHTIKSLDFDKWFIWVNTATLDKPFKPGKRPVSDKTNKHNFICRHCKHWKREGFATIGICELTGETRKGEQMRQKCFEWSDDV